MNSMLRKRSTARFVSALPVVALLMLTHPAVIAAEPKPAGFDAVAGVAPPAKPLSVRAYVQARASRAGWTAREWRSLAEIIHRESRWNVSADNDASSAYGLFQILGLPTGTPMRVQVEHGIRYIKSRYGRPTVALDHWNRKGWY